MSNKADIFVVFIVDDDAKFLAMMKHYLETNSMFNLDIHTYLKGDDCLEHLDLNPDVVILDYYFDDLSKKAKTGLEIQKEILAKVKEAKIIMISGQDDMEVALQTIRDGAYEYIIKDDKAIMRTHLTTDNILQAKAKEQELKQNNRSLRTTVFIMVIFIIALVSFLIYARFK
jgi:DNA-binding NtrC family response regulator